MSCTVSQKFYHLASKAIFSLKYQSEHRTTDSFYKNLNRIIILHLTFILLCVNCNKPCTYYIYYSDCYSGYWKFFIKIIF